MQTQRRMTEKFVQWGGGAATTLSIVLLTALSIACAIWQVYIPLTTQEMATISVHDAGFFLLAAIVIAVLLAAGYLLRQIPETVLFYVLSGIWLAIGIWLLLGAPPYIRADADKVWTAAGQFNAGDFSMLKTGEYLSVYPHQLGLVTAERLLFCITGNPSILFAANLGMILLMQSIQWRGSVLLFPDRPDVRVCTMLLSFAFVPQLFFLLFAYGNVCGLFFFSLGLYCFLRRAKGGKTLWAAGGVLCTALAVLLRNNYIIAVLALCAVLLLTALHRKSFRQLLAGALVMLCAMLGNQAIHAWYEQESGMEIGDGAPKLLWVTMGLQDDSSSGRLGGWNNGYVWSTYAVNGYQTDAAAHDLEARREELAEDPTSAACFFAEKAVSTWCEPTFQSLWSGPLEDCGQTAQLASMRTLYSGGDAYQWLCRILHALLLWIYILSVAALCTRTLQRYIRQQMFLLFPGIYLIGGFLFHLIWETKSQYAEPYVWMLLPLAGWGLAALLCHVRQPKKMALQERL